MRRFLAVLVLLAAIASICHAATRPSIMVRPESQVDGKDVILSNIAAVQCSEKSLSDRLKSVVVCTSPAPSRARKLSKDDIIIALRRAGIDDKKVDLLCPDRISVVRNSTKITGQAIFEAARDYALSATTWPGTAQAEPVRLPTDVEVPVGNVTLKVRPSLRSPHKGQNNLYVDIIADGVVYRSISIAVMIRVIAPVIVARQAIARSAEISEANVAVEQRDITNRASDIIIGENLPIDLVAISSIPEGSIIRKAWVAEPPAIHSGDAVVVVVDSGGARVSEKGTAIQNGRTGEIIKVRLTGSIREVRGSVSEPGVVKILVGGRR